MPRTGIRLGKNTRARTLEDPSIRVNSNRVTKLAFGKLNQRNRERGPRENRGKVESK